jgi:hypothetical protein
MVPMLQLLALLGELRQTVQFAQCAQVMLVSKNVKHANKPFAYWS